MNSLPAAVIVATPADAFAAAVARALHGRGVPVLQIPPADLANLRVTVSGNVFTVDGSAIGAILFRALPDASFSEGFTDEDRAFSDTEQRAIWLAGMHLDSVLAVNRYDAAAWFGDSGWATWRRHLLAAGVPTAECVLGDEAAAPDRAWYPFGSIRPRSVPPRAVRRVLGTALMPRQASAVSLFVCGEIVEGSHPPAAARAAATLLNLGIRIASITVDRGGSVLTVDTQPIVDDVALERSALLLSGLFDAHLRAR